MLSDWDIYKSDPAVLVGIEPVIPIDGPGSLRLGHGATPTLIDGLANLVSKGNAPYTPVGLLRGALAGAFVVPTTSMVFGGVANYPAICCVQSARNVSASAGTCFALCVGTIDVGFNSLTLNAFPAGLVHPIPAALWQTTLTPTVGRGVRMTVELEWEVSVEYGGIRFIVRRGQALNYSDLVTLVDMIHPVTPLPTVSLGEGPAVITPSNDTVTFSCLLDQWRLRA